MRCTAHAILALLATSLAAGEAAKPQKPLTLERCQAFRDLRYLPDDRYTGDPGPRGDREMLLDLFVPSGPGPFPVVLTFHGGAWVTGSKEGQGFTPLMQALLDRGIAVVGFNYIMHYKEIVPQIFYDTQDGVRFLRRHAATYHLDPTRVGVTGISAGGWLASYMGLTHGDVVITGTQGAGVTVEEFAQGGRRGNKPWELANLTDWWGKTPAFAYPAWNPAPAWPEQCGNVQALSYDFSMWHGFAQPASAVPNQWAGEGHHHKNEDAILKAGLRYDYSVLSAPAWKGKGTHGPDFNEPCLSAEGGGTVSLAVRIAQYFQREFGPQGRAPAPEVRPFLRVFDASSTITLLTPDAAQRIHYTTDGSEPTTASPVYAAPFTVSVKTTVKALSTIAGRQPSGVVTATFLPGPVPPRITGPDALPPAERGRPYRVQFSSDVPGAAWRLGGELLPAKEDVKDAKGPLVDLTGLTLDSATGVLSGTPKRGGTYWVQVHCARGAGRLASLRSYRLTIAGDRGPAAPAVDTSEDTNTLLGRLKGWPAAQITGLTAALEKAGCTPVTQEDGDTVLVLVPREVLAHAKPAAQAFAREQGLKLEP